MHVLYSMIVSEVRGPCCFPPRRSIADCSLQYYLNDDFSVIEAEVIDRLDKLFMSQTKGDEISRAFFVSQLRGLFDESNIDDKLRTQVDLFLTSVNSFLDLLLAVRNLPEGEEVSDSDSRSTMRQLIPLLSALQYQEDRIISTLKLMSVRAVSSAPRGPLPDSLSSLHSSFAASVAARSLFATSTDSYRVSQNLIDKVLHLTDSPCLRRPCYARQRDGGRTDAQAARRLARVGPYQICRCHPRPRSSSTDRVCSERVSLSSSSFHQAFLALTLSPPQSPLHAHPRPSQQGQGMGNGAHYLQGASTRVRDQGVQLHSPRRTAGAAVGALRQHRQGRATLWVSAILGKEKR